MDKHIYLGTMYLELLVLVVEVRRLIGYQPYPVERGGGGDAAGSRTAVPCVTCASENSQYLTILICLLFISTVQCGYN